MLRIGDVAVVLYRACQNIQLLRVHRDDLDGWPALPRRNSACGRRAAFRLTFIRAPFIPLN
jgi:hypothetical protein